jgi:eukaryotic-like serine/threonine-protein kinase
MATVYAATDLRLERQVALKIMHGSFAEDPGFVSRFVREARSAAALSDAHVVAVFDQGETLDGVAYLVMEYVDGRTLRDIEREHGRFTPSQALAMLDPVAEAMAAAHRAGIVHRDIKPENVLVDNRGRVKVADFGLARAVTASTSSAATQGLLIGTVAYLSPEQVETGTATARSDVYGAGIVLYELLTGTTPFSGETPLAIAYKHVNSDVPAPSSLDPSIPPSVDAIVARATARNPLDRYADGAELLAAIRATRAALPAPQPLNQRDTIVVPRDSAAAMAAAGAPLVTAMNDTHFTAVLPTGVDDDGPGSGGDSPSKKRRKWPLVLLVLIFVAALAGGGGFYFWQKSQQVTVPKVVDTTTNAAATALSKESLKLSIGTLVFSETVRAGYIIAASPGAGQTATKGDTVRVVVSKGPERHAVPSLKGLTPAAAAQQLTQASLTAGATTQAYSTTVTKGLVVGSNPATGARLKRGAVVALIVSKGPAPVPTPGVVGLSQAAATARLANSGLLVGTVHKSYSMAFAVGIVISTSPSAGHVVSRGTSVNLVVSKGPPPVSVPAVRGLTVSAAESALRAVGLKVKLHYMFPNAIGRVFAQSPGAGAIVLEGSTVTLRIV